jgi:hypothetical protein
LTRLRVRIDATALRLVAGLGLLDAAAWGTWGWQAGLAAAGASLLLLDFLSGDQEVST